MTSSDKILKGQLNIRFTMPDIPREQWCDFRVDLVENGMSLTDIAAKYYCDPRTVRSCIQKNKSSIALGKKSTPPRIQSSESVIRKILLEHIDQLPDTVNTSYGLSCYLYPFLQAAGCSYSERTLRDYLKKSPHAKALLEIQIQKRKLKDELRGSSGLENI